MDVSEVIDVALAWAGHPVGFALLTAGQRQYVGFYDEERRAAVASRDLSSKSWQIDRLGMTTDWNSHRYLTLAIDRAGCLHVAGNMHKSPLTYFRSAVPHDPASLRPFPNMVGREEDRCTYPRFFRGPDGALLFLYRHGSSGKGTLFCNVYDEETRGWRRLVDRPLIDGEGKRGAYFDRFRPFVAGPDGYFHLCWVWRDTFDAASTHDPCYMRSRNLVDWETSDGRRLDLPVMVDSAEVVDPIPPGNGLINGNVCVGFDNAARPIVSYHKFDSDGYTQLFNARREQHGWQVYQTSDWSYRWEFGGGGTIPFEIRIGPVQVEANGELDSGVSTCQAWYAGNEARAGEATGRQCPAR